MSEEIEKEKSFNQQKKKTRRTRKDEEGRNFTCPCGKSYLSYPALYTHTKTKHQGKVPKDDGGTGPIKQQVQEENENKDPTGQIKQIIDKYFPGNDTSAYPTPLVRQEAEYINKILENWENSKEAKLEDPSNNLLENIHNIFGRFLYEIKPQIKAEGFLYFCQLICSLHQGISDEYKDKNYCSTGTGTNLCYYLNVFVQKKRRKQGSPVNNSLLTCKILNNLGVWIFEHRYTNVLVKLNLG